MSELREDSLVKKFSKEAPVAVERGGDAKNTRENDRLRAEGLSRDNEKQGEAEAVASRLAEAARTR